VNFCLISGEIVKEKIRRATTIKIIIIKTNICKKRLTTQVSENSNILIHTTTTNECLS